MADVFARKCPAHNTVLRGLENCEKCLDERRSKALADAGPRSVTRMNWNGADGRPVFALEGFLVLPASDKRSNDVFSKFDFSDAECPKPRPFMWPRGCGALAKNSDNIDGVAKSVFETYKLTAIPDIGDGVMRAHANIRLLAAPTFDTTFLFEFDDEDGEGGDE